jgi:F-type H+-transporting ATPase subunit b
MLEYLQHGEHATTIWVAISFVIFVALAVKLAGKKVTGALDTKIAAIRSEIETAEKLRAETQALLADFQKKQQDAQAEANRIVEAAKASAKQIQQSAEADLDESMARREAQLMDRLKRVEEKAMADIQNHAAELALQATREIVAKSMDEKTGKSLIDQAVASVAKHLN